ncbi:uncharacterized protein LOC121755074 [Salvia splendens]|uniref:uncharacterized protein LOC121755074 n=1 Tax=Salvia splendens TaxID=180675 RepID=UPI001C25429E|nr:uncharacterized protein LOC121755074 [Salvia splendens]
MSSEPLLNYEPPQLNFQFDQNKQLSSSVQLSNKTDDCSIQVMMTKLLLKCYEEKDITRSGESIMRNFISNCTGESILRDVISSLLIIVSLYLMKQTISWIWSLVMFVVMLIIKMIKKLVSDSVEDWIVKTLLHIVMYVLFGRKENTGLT